MSRAADAPTTYRDPVVLANSERSVYYHREDPERELRGGCGVTMHAGTRTERVLAEKVAGLRPCPNCFDTKDADT